VRSFTSALALRDCFLVIKICCGFGGIGGGFLGDCCMLDTEFVMLNDLYTLFLILLELIESSSLLDDGVSGVRIPFTLDLDNCGSEPRLC
jgi:hypothetical protein